MTTGPADDGTEADARAASALSGTTTLPAAHGVAVDAPASFGHLRLRARIGKGSFGEVYRAWDTQLDREVALKLLRADLQDPDRALAEGRMLARVRHPNVLSVFGAARENGRVGIWMEFVNGRSLSELLREHGAYGAREATLIGIDVCRALAAVHAAGLVHRDVKAHNVMREQGGRILLTDFGAGKDAARPDAPAGAVSGTPLYMAPEAFDGLASPATDLYSLGVLLFHLASSDYPVVGATVEMLLESHRAGRQRRLRDVRPDLPDGFIRVVEKAIAPRPQERFPTAGAMESELRGLLGGSDEGASAAARARPSRAMLWAAPLLAAAVVGLLALFARETPEPAPPATTLAAAVTPLEVEARLFRRRGQTVERLETASSVALDDRLFLELRSNRSAYVYVANEDEAGHAYLLFPLPGAHTNPLPAGGPVRLPGPIRGAEQEWTVTSQGGRERVLVVASPSRLDDLEAELRALPLPRAGELAAPLPAAAGARLRGLGGLSGPERAAGTLAALSSTATGKDGNRRVWSQVFELSNPKGAGR